MVSKYGVASGASLVLLAVTAAAQVATTPAPVPTPTPTPLTIVKVSSPTVPAVSPLPTPTPTPTPTAPAAVTATSAPSTTAAQNAALPPLDLSDMRLWNWSGKWHASEWVNADGPIPWRYDHINQKAKADTIFTLNAAGAPQLQAQGGIPAYASGLWETEVTLPVMRDGLVVAPLWIYDPASGDEVDFEFAGRRGLDVTLHTKVKGVNVQNGTRLFAGTDMSGQRKRFGIKVDQAAGYVEMYVDSKFVYRWERSKMSFFVSQAMKPWIQLEPMNPNYSGFVQWAGKWTGLAPGETVTMTVHGYRYTPLPR